MLTLEQLQVADELAVGLKALERWGEMAGIRNGSAAVAHVAESALFEALNHATFCLADPVAKRALEKSREGK